MKHGRIHRISIIGIVLLGISLFSGTTWALNWTDQFESSRDASGGGKYEVYRMGYAFDEENMHVRILTGMPQHGWRYGRSSILPGDLFMNVGGRLADGYEGRGADARYASGNVFGLALTNHSGDMTDSLARYGWARSGYQDNGYDWEAVQAGHLYSDALFSTGVYEGYERSGYGRRSDESDGGYDPFGGANNAPVHIAEFGIDLGFQDRVRWENLGRTAVDAAGRIKRRAYEVTAKISLADLGVQGGERIELRFSMTCGNDFGMVTAVAPQQPVPEPGTMLLLGCGLLGLVGIRRTRRS